jgi:hypothetical protein
MRLIGLEPLGPKPKTSSRSAAPGLPATCRAVWRSINPIRSTLPTLLRPRQEINAQFDGWAFGEMVVPFTVELGTLDVESGHLGERDGYTVGVSGQCRIHGAR